MASFELACCTQVLLGEIADKTMLQKHVAVTYALAISSSEKTDWGTVNKAIMKRWSRSGLERIKKTAWKMIERQKRGAQADAESNQDAK